MTTILEHAGGFENYLIDLAKNLSDSDEHNEVSIITMSDEYTHWLVRLFGLFYFRRIDPMLSHKISFVDVTKRLGNANYIKVRSLQELARRLAGYDVIYSKNELLEGLVLKLLLGYKRMPPVIFGCHTPPEYPRPETIQAMLHNILYSGLLYKFLASGVRAFHTINTHDTTFFTKAFRGRAVYLVPNPFDSYEFRQMANTAKDLPTFPQDSTKILWVGRLTPQKGVDDLIQIVELVNNTQRVGKIQWILVGDGEQRPSLERLANEYSNVMFLGFVEHEKMASIYERASIFLSTSKWEGYPYNILEAQAFFLPVVAYDIPGISDLAKDYEGASICHSLGEVVDHLVTFSVAGREVSTPMASKVLDRSSPARVYSRMSAMLASVAQGS